MLRRVAGDEGLAGALRAEGLLSDVPASAKERVSARSRRTEREAMRRLADWLEHREQLGCEVFARGTPDPLLLDAAPLRACLALPERPTSSRAGWRRTWRPASPRPLWRVSEALGRMRGLLAGEGWNDAAHVLPAATGSGRRGRRLGGAADGVP